MKTDTSMILLGAAFSCAGLLLVLFSKSLARRAIEYQRRRLERPSTAIITRITYILAGLVFGIMTMLGRTIK
jgi:hypothetical protein